MKMNISTNREATEQHCGSIYLGFSWGESARFGNRKQASVFSETHPALAQLTWSTIQVSLPTGLPTRPSFPNAFRTGLSNPHTDRLGSEYLSTPNMGGVAEPPSQEEGRNKNHRKKIKTAAITQAHHHCTIPTSPRGNSSSGRGAATTRFQNQLSKAAIS